MMNSEIYEKAELVLAVVDGKVVVMKDRYGTMSSRGALVVVSNDEALKRMARAAKRTLPPRGPGYAEG